MTIYKTMGYARSKSELSNYPYECVLHQEALGGFEVWMLCIKPDIDPRQTDVLPCQRDGKCVWKGYHSIPQYTSVEKKEYQLSLL